MKALEDWYEIEDERPRSHGGRYIPSDEELAAWDLEQERQQDEDEWLEQRREAGWGA